MELSITPIYALAVACIYLILWMRVTIYRSKTAISVGDNGDQNLLLRVRQHGNCAEWSSFVLILMVLLEGMNATPLLIHASGGLLLMGRIAHPFGLKLDDASHLLRYVGNGASMLAALTAMIGLLIELIGN